MLPDRPQAADRKLQPHTLPAAEKSLKDSHVRDALAALSLSNLSLIGIWNGLLNISTRQTFFLEQAPSRGEYAAAMVNVLLIGIIFFIVIHCARRFPTVVAAALLLLIT